MKRLILSAAVLALFAIPCQAHAACGAGGCGAGGRVKRVVTLPVKAVKWVVGKVK